MKKSLVLIFVVIIAFALVIPVAAKGPGPGGNGPNNPVVIPGGNTGAQIAYSQTLPGPRQTFAMVGRIESIDAGSMTLTINVINGNKLVRDSGLTQVTVSVLETTRYLLKSGAIVTPITFENLEVGQPVSLNGIVTVDGNDIETWTAYRVTVGAYLTQTHKR